MVKLHHLSKSSVKLYETCPYAFYLSKIKGISANVTYPMRRGSEIHEALHYQVLGYGTTPKYWRQCKMYQQWEDLMKRRYPDFAVLFTEKEFFDEELKFKGIIDLVVSANKSILVLDFKSLYPSIIRTFNTVSYTHLTLPTN